VDGIFGIVHDIRADVDVMSDTVIAVGARGDPSTHISLMSLQQFSNWKQSASQKQVAGYPAQKPCSQQYSYPAAAQVPSDGGVAVSPVTLHNVGLSRK
jgi:hypothetical protein